MRQTRTMSPREIVAAYEAGKHLRQLARSSGYSIEGVRQLLLRHGVKIRHRSAHHRDAAALAEELAADLPNFREPVTVDVLTDWFGVQPETASRAVQRLFISGRLVIAEAQS